MMLMVTSNHQQLQLLTATAEQCEINEIGGARIDMRLQVGGTVAPYDTASALILKGGAGCCARCGGERTGRITSQTKKTDWCLPCRQVWRRRERHKARHAARRAKLGPPKPPGPSAQYRRLDPVARVGPCEANTRGAVSELLVAADLLQRGYEVFRAVSAATSCDLLAMHAGVTFRVEVRSTTRARDGKLGHRLSRYDKGRFDIAALVEPNGAIHYRGLPSAA